MKSDPAGGTLGPVATTDPPPTPVGTPLDRLIRLSLLIAVPLLLLAVASVAALTIVRVVGDWRIGIDPLLDERLRPRLSMHELAARGIAIDVLRQILIVFLVVGVARWNDGAAWRRRLALTRPAEPRAPMPRAWQFCLLLLVWPAIHITWVSATAEALHLSFGRGVRLSPVLTPVLVLWWAGHIALLAPLAEEMLIRGEAFARAGALMRPAGAIVSTALLFCVLHISEMGFARPITLLPLAITLGWLRWRTGRLWPCILLHGWSNAALILYLLWPVVH